MSLKLHLDKKEINVTGKGINFIGFIIKHYRKYIRNSTVSTVKKNIRSMPLQFEYQDPKLKKYQSSLNSYFGMFRHVHAYNLCKKLGGMVRSKELVAMNDFRKFGLAQTDNRE